MLGILLTLAVLAVPVLPAFVLGSVRAGAGPWTRHFWES